jgi:hypothetical protein
MVFSGFANYRFDLTVFCRPSLSAGDKKTLMFEGRRKERQRNVEAWSCTGFWDEEICCTCTTTMGQLAEMHVETGL